jgi:Holliday junction resolvasome RuvABC ATP-dependent DNA helicase subunit
LKKTLRLMPDYAHKRSAVLEHVVFYGGPDLIKATLVATNTAELDVQLY